MSYWLHGMNGDNTSWLDYADRFGGAAGERQMNSSRPSFATIGSVDDITNGIASQFAPDAQNIGIGASLGGIVLRNLEVVDQDPSELGGVITVHSPNQGSSLARSVNNGDAEEYLINVVSTLAHALDEINEHLTGGFGFWDVALGAIDAIFSPLNEFLNVTIEIIASGSEIPTEEEITAQITTAFTLVNSPDLQNIFEDMDPTSDFMDYMSNYPSTLPRIEVHGYELDKEPFRLGCSRDKAVWASPLAETTPITDDDCQIFDDLKDAESQLNNAQIALNIKGTLNLLNPVSWLWKKRRSSALFHAAQDVKDAKNLVKNGIEQGWEALLTGTVPTTQTVTQMTAQCAAQLQSLKQQAISVGPLSPAGLAILLQIGQINNDPNCFEEVEITVYVNDPDALYDGLFLDTEQVSGSAMLTLVNGPINGNGVNHVESLNHPSTWNNLNSIFDEPNSFFNTPPR